MPIEILHLIGVTRMRYTPLPCRLLVTLDRRHPVLSSQTLARLARPKNIKHAHDNNKTQHFDSAIFTGCSMT